MNLWDLRKAARRRLPKVVFDYVDGGAEDEIQASAHNLTFQKFKLIPRCLVDVSMRNATGRIFEYTYNLPFGIAPTGLSGIVHPKADLMQARAAAAKKIPFILSGVSTSSIEQVVEAAENNVWFQIYLPNERSIGTDMIQRAAVAGISSLVVTVDAPERSKRERELKVGFGFPPRLKTMAKLEAVLHPAWLFRYLTTGVPLFGTWCKYCEDSKNPNSFTFA